MAKYGASHDEARVTAENPLERLSLLLLPDVMRLSMRSPRFLVFFMSCTKKKY